MNFIYKSSLLLSFVVLGATAPSFSYALTEAPMEERIELQREKALELQHRADALRERTLRMPRTDENPRLQVQPMQEVGIDTTELTQKVEEFKRAKSEFRQNPEILENQKELLFRAIDSLLQHAELLKERIITIPVIELELQESILAEMDADIASLEEFRLSVEQSASSEDLRELAEHIKEYRTNLTQTKVRKLMLLAHTGMFEYRILGLASVRADSIQERLDEFEELGKDISELETLLIEAQESIANTSADLHLLKQDIFENNIDIAFLLDIQIKLHEVKNDVKDVYGIFRDIAKQANEL
jgi:hypothetical protein